MATHEDFPGRFDDELGAHAKDPLVSELRAIRPTPRPEFRRELDRRAAAGFPPRRRDHARVAAAGEEPEAEAGRPRLRDRLSLPAWLRPGPILAGAAVACAIATAVVVSGPQQIGLSNGGGDDVPVYSDAAAGGPGAEVAAEPGSAGETSDSSAQAEEADLDLAPFKGSAKTGANDDVASKYLEEMPMTRNSAPAPAAAGDPVAAGRERRAVERDASLTLATEVDEVPKVVDGVLRVVSEHGGIVMSSTSRGGLEGEAGADFNLKVPSGHLSATLADLSELATVRDRRESSVDITAPTVTMADRLREARAEVRGLLKQLAAATTDAEREAIKIDLVPAQRKVARLRSRLDRLERRANFSTVTVAVVTGEAGALPEEDAWTLSDAAADALDVLTVVAGILLVAAAILAPLALLVALGWVLRRLWVKRARERALRADEG